MRSDFKSPERVFDNMKGNSVEASKRVENKFVVRYLQHDYLTFFCHREWIVHLLRSYMLGE